MKKMLIMSMLLFSYCIQKPNRIEKNDITIPIELSKCQMKEYMNILPEILKRSQKFRLLDSVQNLDHDIYHKKFYEYLYEDQSMKDLLYKAGFSERKYFSAFHDQVVYNFLLIADFNDKYAHTSNNEMEKIILEIPVLEKETSALLLKHAREPNNLKILEILKPIQAKLIAYKNLILIKSFYNELKKINDYAEQ